MKTLPVLLMLVSVTAMDHPDVISRPGSYELSHLKLDDGCSPQEWSIQRRGSGSSVQTEPMTPEKYKNESPARSREIYTGLHSPSMTIEIPELLYPDTVAEGLPVDQFAYKMPTNQICNAT